QCGFKCFSAEAAQKLFPLQTVRGWTFDVEILAMAHQMGFRIVEIPIHWYFREHSKVHVLRDSITMALDLYKIRKTLRRKSYTR
ncbi:MAG: glycosyltransferase family 2 protein, partial [Chloroflexi bacterium]|nr:glycosyltransferase family 2 protein [Chloroflexota bacterium]